MEKKPCVKPTGWCAGLIPSVYDESLSYYEVLCVLREKVNELIDFFNNLDADTLVRDEELQKALNELNNALREYIDSENAEQTVMLKSHILIKLKETTEYLQSQIDNAHISDLMVIYPEGYPPRVTYQEALRLQSKDARMYSMCAKLYDSCQLTCEARDAKAVAAYVFDFYSAFEFGRGLMPLEGVYDGVYTLNAIKGFTAD